METETVVRDSYVLGRALSECRRRCGLTQENAAAKSGMHRSYLAGLEAGKATEQLDRIFRLLRTLDCDLVLRPRTGSGG